MHLDGAELILSATDLSNFLSCRHHTALDMAVAHGVRDRLYHHDPLLELLWQRGLAHEQQYVASLRENGATIVELAGADDAAARVAKTLDAMRRGVDVIVQGGLAEGRWFGKPDIMRRVSRPSALGSWSYEITDTKLARETRAGTILQLGLYSEMLASTQGARPEWFHVVTPSDVIPSAARDLLLGSLLLPPAPPLTHTYRVDDYAAYFRWVREQMIAAVADHHDALAARYYPDPVPHCEVCHWLSTCAAKRRTDDHVSLVAGVTRTQRRELASREVDTLAGLANVPVPLTFKPKRGAADTYVRVREQARLQHESRDRTPPMHELLAITPELGLCRLPQPSPGDLFLDLEGDPFVDGGGREYLFGVAAADGTYRSAWASTDREERAGFEWVIDTIVDAARETPGVHVYHYAPYEASAFKRLMGRYATRQRELDDMLRTGRFIDLYAVVRQALRAGIERYSIKNLEPLYGFTRDVALGDANRALRVMEHGLEMGAADAIPADARATVEGYNRDDCISTLRLRDWLESLRDAVIATGTEVPRPVAAEPDADEIDERAAIVEVLRARLLHDVPETRAERTAEHQGRWLAAYLLDYHRREDKATWWEYYRLCGLEEHELYEEREAVAGLELVGRVGVVIGKHGRPTGSVIDRYRYPAQDIEIAPRDKLKVQQDEAFGDVAAVDRVALTIDVKKVPARAELHPSAAFAFSHVPIGVLEEALSRLGQRVADGEPIRDATHALLTAEPPRLRSGPFTPRNGETEVEFAVRIVGDLDETVLPIQGPPGAGKTYCGAKMICELVRQGKKVGVTATGHRVIRNLLDAVAREASASGTEARLAHKVGDGWNEAAPSVTAVLDNPSALDALTSGAANVLGATAWLWSRPEFAQAVDVLFVDEAGQMALANAVAVAQAARSVVLLGDPQQLEQPRKGSHPDGVDVSALEHLLGDHRTIPRDRGIFLPVTWRLAPAICAFTSELFYEGRLTSRAGLDLQSLAGVAGVVPQGVAVVDVEHDGNRNWSQEEIDVVADLVARLTANGSTWVNGDGQTAPLTGSDVLVVAPYNAQVSRLAERLAGTGARVGTVDKFQGQEAPVVIYSMATSRPEDAPRGMEFLYSLNRLNVATSRARCVAILVASPHLFEPECTSPRQMKLANGLCRFREMAAVLHLD